MTWTTHIQWKGTDLCMDFICPICDETNHFDGRFAYYIRCSHCRTIFRMPTDIKVEQVKREDVEDFPILESIET